jgi:hypothetical protein
VIFEVCLYNNITDFKVDYSKSRRLGFRDGSLDKNPKIKMELKRIMHA